MSYFQMKAMSVVGATDSAVVQEDTALGPCGLLGLVRAESMEIQNDPRFFSGNVIDKRLAAFGKLSIVAGLMMGTSMGQLFSLKKNMNFSKYDPLVGCIGWWQFAGFLLEMTVSFMCIIALYIICHQMFYLYRLMTAGPTGIELASMFYLTKSIVMWRHFAIKCLMNGMTLFMLSSGVTLFVKFIKDADGGPAKLIVVNVAGGSSQDGMVHSGAEITSTLDIQVHAALAYFVLACFLSCACLLCTIRHQHVSAFRDFYASATETTRPITQTLLQMSHRNQQFIPDT